MMAVVAKMGFVQMLGVHEILKVLFYKLDLSLQLQGSSN